jgi:hypothetical protein
MNTQEIAERHGRMHTEAAGTVNNFQFPPQPRLNKTLGHARLKTDFVVTFVSFVTFLS